MAAKEEIADVLDVNKSLFALLNDYKQVIKDKTTALLNSCFELASAVGKKDYNEKAEKTAFALNDYIRALHFRRCILEEIKENFDYIEDLKNGANKETNKKRDN